MEIELIGLGTVITKQTHPRQILIRQGEILSYGLPRTDFKKGEDLQISRREASRTGTPQTFK